MPRTHTHLHELLLCVYFDKKRLHNCWQLDVEVALMGWLAEIGVNILVNLFS